VRGFVSLWIICFFNPKKPDSAAFIRTFVAASVFHGPDNTMPSSFSQSIAATCYIPAPYISGFMARQDFDRLFGARPAEAQASIAGNRKIPLIYTLAGLTICSSVFWIAVFKIVF
jgi:hypothetical protein